MAVHTHTGGVQLGDAVGALQPGGPAAPPARAAEGHPAGPAALRMPAGGRGLRGAGHG